MGEAIYDVLAKIMLCDTEPGAVVDKMAIVLQELPLYYSKQGIFRMDAVWHRIEEKVPFLWWEMHGYSNLPTAARYIVMLMAAIPNQTSCERFLKAYKFVNSKNRANAGLLTAEKFRSDETEHMTRGIKAALVYAREGVTNFTDPFEQVTIDGCNYEINELDRKSWAELFAPPVDISPPQDDRVVLMKIEPWEQPTKKSNEVYYKLKKKFEKLLALDIEDEDEDADLRAPLRQVVRLIDNVS